MNAGLVTRRLEIRTRRATRETITRRTELLCLLGVSAKVLNSIERGPDHFYGAFEKPKLNGDIRIIRPPNKVLRRVQRSLLNSLYQRVRFPPYLHGGIPKKSILTFAKDHVHQSMVATLDVKSFFPSITPDRVRRVFEAVGIVEDAADIAVAVTTLEGSLPQGAPTSCLLANLAFAHVDRRFVRICRRKGLNYGRYIDDLAISGGCAFGELKGHFFNLIREGGFDVADEKVHFQPYSQRQVVTGLVVNDRLAPTGAYVASLKCDICQCRDSGPTILADEMGISVRKLQSKLNGRIRHVARFKQSVGEKLSGLMYSVPWQQ